MRCFASTKICMADWSHLELCKLLLGRLQLVRQLIPLGEQSVVFLRRRPPQELHNATGGIRGLVRLLVESYKDCEQQRPRAAQYTRETPKKHPGISGRAALSGKTGSLSRSIVYIPFVSESMTPADSRYFLKDSFFVSAMTAGKQGQLIIRISLPSRAR